MAIVYLHSVIKKILDLILNHAFSKRYANVQIENYQNGREQGYALVFETEDGDKKAISFSLNRNSDGDDSDDIIVYFGTWKRNGLTDDAYYNKKYFEYESYEEVVKYIFDILDENITPCKERKGIELHPSLKIADEIIEHIMKDERFQPFDAVVQSLQKGDLNGYKLYKYGLGRGSQSYEIGFGKKGEEILLYKKECVFQEKQMETIENSFPLKDISEVVESIYMILLLEK